MDDTYTHTAMAVSPDQRDTDVDALLVTSFQRLGSEFMIKLKDGNVKPKGPAAFEMPGAPVNEYTVTVTFSGSDQAVLESNCDIIEEMLSRWHDEAVLLRLAAAPGKMSILAENDTYFIPIPRAN